MFYYDYENPILGEYESSTFSLFYIYINETFREVVRYIIINYSFFIRTNLNSL